MPLPGWRIGLLAQRAYKRSTFQPGSRWSTDKRWVIAPHTMWWHMCQEETAQGFQKTVQCLGSCFEGSEHSCLFSVPFLCTLTEQRYSVSIVGFWVWDQESYWCKTTFSDIVLQQGIPSTTRMMAIWAMLLGLWHQLQDSLSLTWVSNAAYRYALMNEVSSYNLGTSSTLLFQHTLFNHNSRSYLSLPVSQSTDKYLFLFVKYWCCLLAPYLPIPFHSVSAMNMCSHMRNKFSGS